MDFAKVASCTVVITTGRAPWEAPINSIVNVMPILLRSKAAQAWIQLRGVAREAKRGPPFSPVRFDLDCQPTAWHLFPSSVCVPSRLPLLAIVSSQRVTTLCEGRQGPFEVIPYSKIAAPASAAAMAQTSFAQHCYQKPGLCDDVEDEEADARVSLDSPDTVHEEADWYVHDAVDASAAVRVLVKPSGNSPEEALAPRSAAKVAEVITSSMTSSYGSNTGVCRRGLD